MVDLTQLGLHLLPAVLTSAVHAVAKATEGAAPSAVSEFIAGLATDAIKDAAEVAHQAIKQLEAGGTSFSLFSCCFAIAWKSPAFVADWSDWVRRLQAGRYEIAIALSFGPFNATVIERDPEKWLALAERIEKLHRDFGQEPIMLKRLIAGLHNAASAESDFIKRQAIAEHIQELRTQNADS